MFSRFSHQVCLRNDHLEMWSSGREVAAGDTVIIWLTRDLIQPLVITPGKDFNTRYGNFKQSDFVGVPYGSKVIPKSGRGFIHLLRPTPELWTLALPHRTQILYVADIAFITSYLGIRKGSKVIEAGTLPPLFFFMPVAHLTRKLAQKSNTLALICITSQVRSLLVDSTSTLELIAFCLLRYRLGIFLALGHQDCRSHRTFMVLRIPRSEIQQGKVRLDRSCSFTFVGHSNFLEQGGVSEAWNGQRSHDQP